jgi:uncharacterized protein (TIGR02246 family)
MKIRRGVLACLLGAIVLLTGLVAVWGHRPRLEARPQDKPAAGGAVKDDATRGPSRLSREVARAEEKAIRKALDSFTAAFNKGDLEGLMTPWTEDAEFASASGKVYRGKAQVRVLLKKSLTANKGARESIQTHSIRFLKPDVAIEEGVVTLTTLDGAAESGRYESLWVKQNERWYMSRVRDLPDRAEEGRSVAHQMLKPLAWMVGEWVDKDGKGDVAMTCRWSPGQTFLLQEYPIKQNDGTIGYVWLRIGWDAAAGQLRSWVFDSMGGFGEGRWKREGNDWLVPSEGHYPDGRKASSDNRWKYVNDETTIWTSRNRQAEGQPLPDLTITFIKKKPR